MLTLWRHARIATCDEQSQRVRSWRAAHARRDDRVGRRRGRTAGRTATRPHDRTRRPLGDAGTRRLPHAPRVRRTARRRIRATHGGHELCRHRPRGRRHPEHRARDPRARARTSSSRRAGRGCARCSPRASPRSRSSRATGSSSRPRHACCAWRAASGPSEPVTVSTSLLAAHALPPEFAGRADEYIDTICHDWLPRLAAPDPHPAFGHPLPLARERVAEGRVRAPALINAVDAYCEDIAFSARAVRPAVRRRAGARPAGAPARRAAVERRRQPGRRTARRAVLRSPRIRDRGRRDRARPRRHGGGDAAGRVLCARRDSICRRSRRCAATAWRSRSPRTATRARRPAPRCCSR